MDDSLIRPENKPKGRRSHSAIHIGEGKVLVFGGYDPKGPEHFDDLWLLDTNAKSWRKVIANGTQRPNKRRRQALVKVGSKIFLFGGTSPYQGPPIQYTPSQLGNIPETSEDTEKLVDHYDLFVLDLNPSLLTLAKVEVMQHKLSLENLPHSLRKEIEIQSKPNSISPPLSFATSPSG